MRSTICTVRKGSTIQWLRSREQKLLRARSVRRDPNAHACRARPSREKRRVPRRGVARRSFPRRVYARTRVSDRGTRTGEALCARGTEEICCERVESVHAKRTRSSKPIVHAEAESRTRASIPRSPLTRRTRTPRVPVHVPPALFCPMVFWYRSTEACLCASYVGLFQR